MTCTTCGHEHKKSDGTCDCGCSMKMEPTTDTKPKVCAMCGHEHTNADGTCSCGCDVK